MKKIPYFLKIFAVSASILVLFSLIFSITTFQFIKKHHLRTVSTELERLGFLIGEIILPPGTKEFPPDIDSRVKNLGKKLGVRITVILPDGMVIADSQHNPATMDNHSHRPEIRAAYSGKIGVKIRYSRTIKADMLYVAIPLRREGKLIGVVRVSVFLSTLKSVLTGLKRDIALVNLALLLLLLGISLLWSRKLTSSVKILKETAHKISQGDLKARAFLKTGDELEDLSREFNSMAQHLEALLNDYKKEISQLQAILSSMAEPLALIDKSGKLLRINPAMEELLGKRARGKYYWEVFLSEKLVEFTKKALKAGKAAGEVSFKGRWYIASASSIPEAEETVIVLHDVTQMKELERIKREFVINASHEFKTPLTAIKGFVEALMDEEAAHREYLQIIKRNTERLIKITESLMLLGKLEAIEEIERERVNLKRLGENLLEIFRPEFFRKGLKLEFDAEDIEVEGDAFLLEQVLINLLDNALKYTDSGEVRVRIYSQGNWAIIEVSDTGIGIPEEHVHRIFERFYVVDRSRSRARGGTGLGLSIVKHIVLNHNGKIEVKSRQGEGSTFKIFLPLLNQ